MESRVERRERERREEARREAVQRDRVRKRRRELEREMAYEEAYEKKRRKERGRRRGKIGGIIALIIIILLGLTAMRVYMEMRPGANEPAIIAGSGNFDGSRVNILFLGTNQGLSDTIMVMSLNYEEKRLDMLSIPRDTYYPRSNFPGATFQKVNAVYSTEGPEGAAQAASDILGGIPIHYYAEIDTKGAARIIDAMGGVTMDIPFDMIYTDVDQDLYINLMAGTQHLNGEQAVHFARYRSGYATADLGRIGAQQELLKAMMAQADGFDIPKVAIVASAETQTNMSTVSQLAYAGRLAGMRGGSFNTYMIPGTPGMKDGLSYYFHDADATLNLVKQLYNM